MSRLHKGNGLRTLQGVHLGLVVLMLGSGTTMRWAVDEVVSKGPDLTGIAAIIAASAGMLSAVGALIIGLRSKASDDAAQKDLLMDLVEELKAEREKNDMREQIEAERKGRRR